MDITPPKSTKATVPEKATENEASPEPFKWMEQWYPVAWAKDVIDLKPLSVTLWDRHYVLFRDRSTGIYVVMDDICPHRAAPLSEGRLYERETDGRKETVLECGYHGWRFDCDGRCVDIPVVPLEKRIPAAADVGAVYATHLSVNGLIFMWLGDRLKADESKIPLPEELLQADESERLFTLDTFRYFPISFSTLHENVADPAHVSWAHHGTGQGNRETVKRSGGVDIVHENLTEGYVHAKVYTPDSNIDGREIFFQAPTAVHYAVKLGDTKSKVFLMSWTVPISWDKSKMFSAFSFLNPPKIVRLVNWLSPRWYEHRITNLILDGDSPLLQKQYAHLQAVERDGYGGAWKKEYTLASGKWDTSVMKVRQFFDMHGWSMPYATPIPSDSRSERISSSVVNDRYENHTRECQSCSAALRNFTRGRTATLVGAAVSGAAALFSGIVFAALSTSGAAFAPLPLRLAGFGGIVLCMLLLRLAKTLHYFMTLMTFTDIAYDLNHSD